MENVLALETMKEGHDGSGMGLGMQGLGGEFRALAEYPALSCICSKEGYRMLDEYMLSKGFKEIHMWSPRIKPVTGIVARDYYLAKFYEYPEAYRDKSRREKEDLLLATRLELRVMGQAHENITVFSFYPDMVTLKEVGDPLALGEFFGLDRDSITAKVILAQGRQNTNYAINLYACHPFFLQGYCSMTNGENTAFIPIREYLIGRGLPGYVGYSSDSEVFTHILHYVLRELKYPLTYYKDVITPLSATEIAGRPDAKALQLIKAALRMLTIDGPNCNIGFLPDGTCYMVQDAKKLRPGAVGGVPGKYALMSEACGVGRAVPERDPAEDIYPMKYDMVIISPDAADVNVWSQLTGDYLTGGKQAARVMA
jgi:glutamate synthase domain-containing protein 1